jgi:hypothetical protein
MCYGIRQAGNYTLIHKLLRISSLFTNVAEATGLIWNGANQEVAAASLVETAEALR